MSAPAIGPYFKVLNWRRRSCHGGTQVWTPGEWVWVAGEIAPCERGIHFCDAHNLVHWLGATIWEFEPAGEVRHLGDKLVAQGGRITRQVETWNARTARLFVCDCAERVVHLCRDERSRAAITVARRFANGEATVGNLEAARAAAWAAGAAWAAWAAARVAERAAAEAAAWAAAATDRAWQSTRLMSYLRGEVA